MALVCFEVDPAKVAGVPVLGVDPIPDYRSMLEAAGLKVVADEETPDWEERVYASFQALVDNSEAVTAGMGEGATAGTLAEAILTVAMKPYPQRALALASKPS